MPLPRSLVVKNGSKMWRLGVLVHADAGVAHRQHHVGPGVERRVALGERVVDLDVRGLDDQLAAVGHRVARVHHQIEHHLLELARIHLHAPQIARRDPHQLDVLADQPPQQDLHVDDHLVHVEDRELEHLLAAEGQQLPREPGGALGGLLDLHCRLAARIDRPGVRRGSGCCCRGSR